MIDYSHLNHYIPPSSQGLSEAWKRVMARLGDYTGLIVRALNLRPTSVSLHGQTDSHLLVRVVTPGAYLVLRAAPEDDLAAYSYFLRAMAGQRLPCAQLIQRDLSRTLVPFAYTLEAYVPGIPATQIEEPHLLRAAGRQAGRALRRMHRVAVPGCGRPNPAGRWSNTSWPVALRQIGQRVAPPPTDSLLFSPAERATLTALLERPCLGQIQPALIHGAFGPQSLRCTTSEAVHLEAIVEPGTLIGGDGLYDLACGMRPTLPEPWRAGLFDGYITAGPLTDSEQERLPILRLLASYWGACHSYMRGQPHEADLGEAHQLLSAHTALSERMAP